MIINVRTIRRGLLTWALLLTLVPVSAKVRVMLISDPHVLSGDLTKDGELLSHQYVVKKLNELKEAGIKVFVVPGNHDMGTGNAYYYDGSLIHAAETINTSQFAEMYKDFGYGADIDQEPTTLTWCCEPFDGLVLIGIDTGHEGSPLNGVISKTTLDWVVDRVKTATKAGKQVVVMMHHSLFPHVTNAEKASSTYAVKLGLPNGHDGYAYYRYSTVRDAMIDAGAGVVLSGHVHASDIAKDTNVKMTRTIHDISTATCAAYPNPYRLLTINDDETMSIRTRYITELPGVEDFQALAKERLVTSLKNLVFMYIFNEEAADILAEIFVLHVCGDEPENPRSQELVAAYEEHLPELMADGQLNYFLNKYGVTFDEMNAMAYGLLEDKTNYGDPERESFVEDRNTTIPLRSDGWTAIKGVKTGDRSQETGVGSQEGWYTLQGQRVAKPSRKGIYIHNGKLILH